jgi:hypothetical protein
MIELFDALIRDQQAVVVSCARRIIPHLTEEDILQPNDFPQLENHPHFRYEEGLLAGLHSARMAFLAESRNNCCVN